MLIKVIKFALLTLFTYLVQATVPFHIAIADVAPNLAIAMIAAVSIALGRRYTFIMSLTIGYLLEIMMPVLDYINLLIYPVVCMLGALVFSDKSERKLEEERTQHNRTGQWDPHIRTILCALLSILLYEGVHVLYIYLTGVDLDRGHIGRAFIDVGYTTALSAVLQFPIRWYLGTYRIKKARA